MGVRVAPLLPFNPDDVVQDFERRTFLAHAAVPACAVRGRCLDEVFVVLSAGLALWLILGIGLLVQVALSVTLSRQPPHQLRQLMHELPRHNGWVLIAKLVRGQPIPSEGLVVLVLEKDLGRLAFQFFRWVTGVQPQQPSRNDRDQYVGLTSVAGQGHEELGRAQLLVHVHCNLFLCVDIGMSAGDVPEGGEDLTSAFLVLRLPM